MKQFNPLQYLAIDIANQFGLDKLPYEQRLQWVRTHLNDLENHIPDADEPVLYAKAVHALRQSQQGLPVGHYVAFDSACSGLQLMSVMMNCQSGMAMTGLIDPDERTDAYTIITNALNERLAQVGKSQVTVTRDQAKKAVMTSLYGSKAVPQRIFGDELLPYFYEVMREQCQGAWQLLEVLADSWNSQADHHTWLMPDNHTVYVPVMQTADHRIKIEELSYQPTVRIREQQATDYGISNIANVVHSVDAYVLRSLIRRCNYNPAMLKKFLELDRICGVKDTDDTLWFNQRYQATNIADVSMIYTINSSNIEHLDPQLRGQLSNIARELLTYPPFEVVTIHDSFACHPNHLQRLREQYNEVLVSLYDSTLTQDLLSQLFTEDIKVDLGERALSETIRQSNYGIC